MPWLAYAHPAAMLLVLLLGGVVLREGILSRRARLAGRRFDRRRHRRLGRIFVVLVLLGFGAGVASMAGLRERPVFESIHGWIAAGATLGLTGAALLGRRLERAPDDRSRAVHALCGALGMLFALTAAVAGFAILP